MALKEEKVELLRRVDFFSQLREYELDRIAEYSEFIKFKKGRPVFTQKSESGELYVVADGRIGIISVDENGDTAIAQITAGESFGELDFLGRTPRSASAFADEESVLLKFPSSGYKVDDLYGRHPEIFARLLYRLLATISERIWNVNRLLYSKTGWFIDLQKQLLCDKMTGLYNQVYLKEDFLHLIPDTGDSVALIMLKPDNFKEVNDRFGHVAGDQVLNLMAIFLQSELGENDIGVRYRGDEYVAILPYADRSQAFKRADAIRRAYEEMDLSAITGSEPVKLSLSIGIAVYPDDARSSGDLVTAAHEKMYAAKNSGGNRILV